MFVKLPITIFQPNNELDRLDIPYEVDEKVWELNVRIDHIQMYFGNEDGTTSCWMLGSEQAHIVELNIVDFEMRLNGLI